jgi:hypothetical protein
LVLAAQVLAAEPLVQVGSELLGGRLLCPVWSLEQVSDRKRSEEVAACLDS